MRGLRVRVPLARAAAVIAEHFALALAPREVRRLGLVLLRNRRDRLVLRRARIRDGRLPRRVLRRRGCCCCRGWRRDRVEEVRLLGARPKQGRGRANARQALLVRPPVSHAVCWGLGGNRRDGEESAARMFTGARVHRSGEVTLAAKLAAKQWTLHHSYFTLCTRYPLMRTYETRKADLVDLRQTRRPHGRRLICWWET